MVKIYHVSISQIFSRTLPKELFLKFVYIRDWTLFVFNFFTGIAIYFLLRPVIEIELQEKIVFGAFFAGAIICLGCSFMFHTVSCHSQFIGKLFSKLDYCGIALLIMGSFVPWLYYGFYCHFKPKVVYLSVSMIKYYIIIQ